MTLEKYFEQQQWDEFASLFRELYLSSTQEQQLVLLRSLLCKYRDVNAMKAVISLGLTK